METISLQTAVSQLPDEKQVPASAVKKMPQGQTGWSKETGLDGTLDKLRAPTETNVRRGFMQSAVSVSLDLEEYFEALVDEIDESAVRLRTVSSTGEEGIAWLPIAEVPEGERPFIELGAPVRVSIVLHSGAGANVRKTHIRVLRPFQWRPSGDAEKTTDFLMERMKAILGGG